MAIMKLVLLQDVEDLGIAGEEISVAAGYGRNYLVPRKLAAPLTTAVKRQLEARKAILEEERKKTLEAAQQLAAQIEKLNVKIQMQSSEDGHLFGSVSERMIADAIKAQGNIELNHQRIHLEGAIRTTGEFKVNVKLHTEVITSLKVTVEKAG